MGVDLTHHIQVTDNLEHESEAFINTNIHLFKKSNHKMVFDLNYLRYGTCTFSLKIIKSIVIKSLNYLIKILISIDSVHC